MEILIAGLNYAPEPTATGKYTGEMAAWLATQGHDVDAICGLPHYPAWQVDERYQQVHRRHGVFRERLEGVGVFRVSHFVPSADKLTALARIWMETSYTLSAARFWIPKLFSRNKPAVQIAVMPPMQIGVWPLLYGWVRRVPVVLHVQDLQVDAALRLSMLKVGVLGRLLFWIESFLLRHATVVSTITEAMCRRVIEKGVRSERVWLFPNWADINAVRPLHRADGKVEEFRRGLGLSPDHIVVLYAGNMGEKQGLGVVLEAADRMREENNVRFVLLGGGGARQRLEALAGRMQLPNLQFAPVQPLERLPAMLGAGDIHLVVQQQAAADLVMPSKLTNILAAGRPCVATADEGTALADVVAGGENGAATGLVSPPEDADALVTAIRTLAADAQLRERCGRNARAFAEEHLDKDAILSRFERQLIELVNKKENEQ